MANFGFRFEFRKSALIRSPEIPLRTAVYNFRHSLAKGMHSYEKHGLSYFLINVVKVEIQGTSGYIVPKEGREG